ncbi:hypothetical protein [Rhodanobacter sp. UC4451_H18]
MNKFRLIKTVPTAFFLALAIMSPFVFARDTFCPDSDSKDLPTLESVDVLLLTNKEKFKLDDIVTIYAAVLNDGEHPVYVYRKMAWGYGGGFILEVNDDFGGRVSPKTMDDTMLPPPRNFASKDIFVELRSGNFIGLTRVIKIKDLVHAAGNYTLRVIYRSPLSCSILDKKLQLLPALWHEDRPISSSGISIKVVK